MLPAQLQASVAQAITRITDALDATQQSWLTAQLQQPDTALHFSKFWAGSEFAVEQCVRHPQWLLEDAAAWALEVPADHYTLLLQQRLATVTNEDQLHCILRETRNRAMLRIIYRDLNRIANTQQTVTELSQLADACIVQALDFLTAQMVQELGQPIGAQSGKPQQLLVIAMGKLGAGELNLSSDIDLIFVFPEQGETRGAKSISNRRSIDNQEFFTRLGQKLIKALDQKTVDGFVFRVDMRLRPYGQSGALALNFAALEEYYVSQGRDWERYAMIKARFLGGDAEDKKALAAILRPFTYRRYIDFSVIDALREMKRMIVQEVKRKGMAHNVKLGPGGIREVEFIAQVFQLIHGGRDADFQQRELLSILQLLKNGEYLPAPAVDELRAAYLYLRDVEHLLQAWRDEQTQLLPPESDELVWSRLAWLMGCESTAAFTAQLEQHRVRVSHHFAQIVASDDNTDDAQERSPWAAFWLREMTDEEMGQWLSAQGFTDSAAVLAEFSDLQHSAALKTLQQVGRERLDVFMPLLLSAVANTRQADANADCSRTLLRIMPLVRAVLRRSAYLVLLNENPGALQQLVLLCSASPWIAAELAWHPVLLDELIDERTLYTIPDRDALRDDLRHQATHLSLDDQEAHMEMLRHFKLSHGLRVAACEVTGSLPLMKVSDYLTFLAEIILEHVFTLAWHVTVKRHGYPLRSDGTRIEPGFIVVAYGKLGGIELGHSSDLDLVFIHDADALLSTDGENAVDNGAFYARLGQRMIHTLTTRTTSGELYEVDMRLRPSGNSGLLVSSIEAFRKYQQESAWTWEHQALVRARCLFGSSELASRFTGVRAEVLGRERDLTALRQEVKDMRRRMRESLGTKSTDSTHFDLKHDAGGIVDIEFMVQYAVLAWAHSHPELLRWTDNIRILETLGQSGIFSPEKAQLLTSTYKALRVQVHQLALQAQPLVVDASHFATQRAAVVACWCELLDDAG